MTLKKLCLASAAFVLAATASMSTSFADPTCPPPQRYTGTCIQVVVWAKDSNTGMCCQYGSPCAAPDGWQIFYGPNCTNPTIEEL